MKGFNCPKILSHFHYAVSLLSKSEQAAAKTKCLTQLNVLIMNAIPELFMNGNPLCMSVLTLLLALVFLAAWKAPAWVRNIGLIAMACGLLFGLLGLYQMFDYLRGVEPDSCSAPVIYGGYRCALVPVMYGTIILIISLIVHLLQKPRI